MGYVHERCTISSPTQGVTVQAEGGTKRVVGERSDGGRTPMSGRGERGRRKGRREDRNAPTMSRNEVGTLASSVDRVSDAAGAGGTAMGDVTQEHMYTAVRPTAYFSRKTCGCQRRKTIGGR